MMTYKKQISTLAMAVAMTLAMVSEANAVTFPFTGVKVTPPQDVIAANLDEITPHNTVTVVHNITQVTPTLTASQMPNPTSASFGVVTAFKDPNMSQKVPDCAPPPTPPSNCNNIGQCGSPGNVSWSGWDKVSGGVCNTGGAGGWMVTAAGAAPANYYPPPAQAMGDIGSGQSYVTPYGNTITNNGNGTATVKEANGYTVQTTINSNGSVTFGDQAGGNVTTDSFSNGGYASNNTNGAQVVVAGGTLYGNNAATTAAAYQQGTTGAYTNKVITSSSAVQSTAQSIGVAGAYASGANGWG
ncbi:hypothetical protein HAP94_01560 [Acidithiobacillus ferrivorans]|nr:hypothetical protein [Acidithiobacillus ferrivorans]